MCSGGRYAAETTNRSPLIPCRRIGGPKYEGPEFQITLAGHLEPARGDIPILPHKPLKSQYK